MHLVIDGYTGNRSLLRDQEHVRGFLDAFPDRIGMTKIITPHVLTYNGPVPEDWGVSGFVIIAESHISVHTFPDRSFVQVDVFSCKDFDTDLALEDVKASFDLHDANTWVLERGLDHYSPEQARRALDADRARLSAPA